MRHWTAKRAAQACCYALQEGATEAELHALIAQCDPNARKKPEEPASEALAALQVAAVALEANNVDIDKQVDFLSEFMLISNFAPVARLALRFIPYAGTLLTVAIAGLRQVATGRLTQVAVQKAANSDAIAIVRRAAANEARFLRTGTR